MFTKNILITGANGQLGSEIKSLCTHYTQNKFYFTGHAELDIANKHSVEDFVKGNNIEVIINCAAYTAVDKAESEPGKADTINHLAVRSLAKIAKVFKISLIHISTDYVFDGKGYQPYQADYPPNPINVYGKTKLKGEIALKEVNPINSLIIRTSWVHSSWGNNFVKTMLRLGKEREQIGVVCDQIGAPTYARDLAEFILNHAIHVQTDSVKTYHYTNEGVCSWYDFAKEIMELGKIECKVIPIPTTAYPTPAGRPSYSLMDKSELKMDFGNEIPYWKDSLKKCMEKMK